MGQDIRSTALLEGSDRRPGANVTDLASVRRSRVILLGGFGAVTRGGRVHVTRNPQRVLAFLAVRDRPMPREDVAASLWLDTTDGQAAANLRSALWKIGKALPGFVCVHDGSLGLDPRVSVDLRDGLALVRTIASGGPRGPANEGIDLLSHDLLPTWDDDWAAPERERFRQLRLHALETLCHGLASNGRYGAAVEAGLAAVAGEDLRESAHRALIGAYLAEGNFGEAVRQYREFRGQLRAELDLEPSAAMEELVAGVMH
jgi:DNA-binding SARP family transcriptional activator